MKPTQASIYRAVERLLQFAIGVTERLPKSLPFRVLGECLIVDLKDSLDYIVLAFQAPQGAERLRCIDHLILRMTSVKTTFRTFLNAKVVSPKQHSQFLGLITNVGTQAGAWRSKQLLYS